MKQQSDGRGDGGGEAVDWAPVVGVKDSPVLQVGNDTPDDCTDTVDGAVEGFLPVEQFTSVDLLDGCDHVSADVAFVSCPVAGIEHLQDAGLVQAEYVVVGSLNRIGDPDEFAVEGAHDLHVHARGLVLARVQARVSGP